MMKECIKPEEENRVRPDALTELILTGAQNLLAQALKAEVAELLTTYANQRDNQGYARDTLCGHHPTQEIQPGIGLVRCACQEFAVGRANRWGFTLRWSPVCAQGDRLEAAIPWLYKRDLNRGDVAGSGSPGGA